MQIIKIELYTYTSQNTPSNLFIPIKHHYGWAIWMAVGSTPTNWFYQSLDAKKAIRLCGTDKMC